MPKYYMIDSHFEVGAELPDFSQEIVKNEPMFFSAQPAFAYEHGGPITKAFLDAAVGPGANNDFSFDSRVHMLMPGWFPCIPGWHHDDVPRSRGDGQPNYESPEYHAKHILALINGDICPTEFAVGESGYPHTSGTVYRDWHPLVEEDIRDNVLKRVVVPSNRLIHFDANSWHQGTQAVKGGWRWFGRLSWDAGYEQGRPHYNEIRRQVQVYLEFPMEGW